jgi:signal peptidase II
LIRRYVVAVGLATGVVVVDALTKRWASIELQGNPIEIVPGFLTLTYTENSGAAFGLFQNAGPVLGIAAIAVTAALAWSLRVDRPGLEVVAFGLIMGGAVGNLIDRVFRGDGFLDGMVIDWVNLWWIPTFNVADAAITVAVVLLVIHSWLNR